MDDFDIYSDLPDFKWLKETYEENIHIKKEELPISEEDVKILKEKFLKLEKVHKLVLLHYSSLWKTCKQERKRMDRQIADLRSQLDNFAFKRNHHRHKVVPVPIQSLVARPPPLLNTNPFSMQNVNQENLYSYPPSINTDLDTNQEWNQEEQKVDKNLVDNLAVPTNVITPENSHSSDESDDDIVKKSVYRSTVYGERLRKKLLEEKRNAMRQKEEPVSTEKKANQENWKPPIQNEFGNVSVVNKIHVSTGNEITTIKREIDTKMIKEENSNRVYIEKVKEHSEQEQLTRQKQFELKNINKVNILSVLKEPEVTSVKKEAAVETLKEESSDRRQSKIVKEPLKQEQKLRNQKENETKENKKDQLKIKRESDVGRKKNEEDLRSSKVHDTDKKRQNDDSYFDRERVLSKRIEDEELKVRRERNLDRRKRNDESGSRRERNLDRRRKEELEKFKREEQLERRRRQEDAERRRKDQETERRMKEDIDKRRRTEIDRRRRDEEIERRRREEEIERRKRDEFDRRRKEEEEKKRKDRDSEILKQKENDRRRKEEEQHQIRLKEIEKKRNEKQLEELINERKRIENEMNTLTGDESENEEKPVASKDMSRREYSSAEKSQENRAKSKENIIDNSVQALKKPSDSTKNDESNEAGQSSCENRHSPSANSNSQPINSDHGKACHEHASSDRQQDSHTTYDKQKYNVRRSRRDQLDHELERRNSSQRNKSRHRNKSNSACKSDEDSHSPKRIKLQEKDKDFRDRLKNLGAEDQSKKRIKSPKRKRQSKSNEKSPQKSKKRKISPGRGFDINIRLDENIISKTNIPAHKEIDKADGGNNKNISSNCSTSSLSTVSNRNASACSISTKSNIGSSLQKEKEQLAAACGKDQDKISNQLTNLRTAPKVACKTEDQVIDPNRENRKLINSVTDKSSNNHVNKKKTLMNELFEAQEEPVNIPASLKNVKRTDETLNETILSELEDGEITDSDEDSKSLQKSTLQATIQPKDKAMQTIQFSEKNNNNEDKCSASLQENNKLITSKSTSEVKHSILYNVLVHGKNDICQEKTTVESHENVSNKTEPATLKNNKKAEACQNKIAGKAEDKSSFQSETNNMTDVCMKENVDINSGLIKSMPSTIVENLNKKVLKPLAKIETASKDNAAGNRADTSQIKVPIRNVIVIKRRRRPVKLADSPPVVVINNTNVKT